MKRTDDLRGLPLEEAFEDSLSRDQRKALAPYAAAKDAKRTWIAGGELSAEQMRRLYWETREPMQQAFIDSLSSGERLATGLQEPLHIRSVREIISPELWGIFDPDFDESELAGPDTTIIEVEVLSKAASEKLMPPDPGPELVPIIKSNERRTGTITLSADDKQLTINGKAYLIRGEIQQVILRQLVGALRSGQKKLETARVLEFAGSNSNSLTNAFKRSPHFGPLKDYIREEAGLCWLEI